MLNSLVISLTEHGLVEPPSLLQWTYFCCSAMNVRTFCKAVSRSPLSLNAPPRLLEDVDARLLVLSNLTSLKEKKNVVNKCHSKKLI